MTARTSHMTEGSPGALILSFALPLMIGNVFQQLYTVVDTMVVGKALGVDALAALGSAEWPNWLMLGLVQGLTQGFSIPMSCAYGAGKKEELRQTVGNALTLSLFSSILLLIAGQSLVKPLLLLLHTPEEILGQSLLYLRVMFLGVPVVILFNLQAAVLRALGDGRTPLCALVVSSLSNIGLDLLFVLGFGQGILGAAAATLMAQAISNIYCFLQIRKIKELHIGTADCQTQSALLKELLRHGVPMSLQNMLITVGSLIVQFVVNQYGVFFIAGFAAANKLYGVLEIAAVSYGYAMVTYAGQNLGARKLDRIRRGYRTSLAIAIATALLISLVIFVFGSNILLLFLSGPPEEVEQTLAIAYRYLRTMGFFLPVLYILHVTRSTIQGMGNTVLPMAAGIMELGMRVTSALALPALFGQSGIFYAEVMAWIGSDVVLLPGFLRTWKKKTAEQV